MYDESPPAACKFGAVSMTRDRAYIDPDKCKECGMCAKACPYNAIADLIRPCKKICPANAITMDENGICEIDENKCIQCGQCIHACPFGAIGSKTDIVDVIKAIVDGKKVVAMVAPAVGRTVWRHNNNEQHPHSMQEAGL